MSVIRINCPACAAPVEVVAEQTYSRCPFCNSTLRVESSRQGANQESVATLARETSATRSELQRMQLLQEAGLLKSRLSSVQGEIRTLEREKATAITRRQLIEVRNEREEILQEIERLNARLALAGVNESAPVLIETESKEATWQRLFSLFFMPVGRISRSYFAAGLAVLSAISFILSPFYSSRDAAQAAESGGGGVLGLLTLLILYAYACIAVKRYHDIDKSGWWYFIAFIPFLIFYQWYELLFLSGTEGRNRFGAQPTHKVNDLLPVRGRTQVNQSPGSPA